MSKHLPKGWEKTTLGAICLPVEKIHPEDSPNVEFTYFDIGGIDNKRNKVAEIKTLNGRNAPSRARQSVRKGDILFSTVRTYLRNVARIESDYPNPIASTGFAVIRAAQGVSSEFLLFQILSDDFLQPLHLLQSGSSYPAVSSRDVFAQPILLPPTKEQQRIVAKLGATWSQVANGETATHRAREGLEPYRAAVLHDGVTGELTRKWRESQSKNSGPEIENGEALLRRILSERRRRWEENELQRLQELNQTPKNDKWQTRYPEPTSPRTFGLPKIPDSWVWASLSQLGEVNRGRSKHRPRDDARLYGGKYPFIQTADIRKSSGTITEHSQTYNDFGLEQSRLWPTGTLCITIAANIAETGILSYPACFPDSIVGFLQDEELLNVRFIEFFIRSEKAELERYAPATAQKNINLRTLEGLAVPLPPLPEQREIVSEVQRRLSGANQLAAVLERQLKIGNEMRQSLLRDALAGRLVPQAPDDEKASFLLERILTEKARVQAEQNQARQERQHPKRIESGGIAVKQTVPSEESLTTAWKKIGKKTDARRLFDEAGFVPEQVIQFYEMLRATSDVRAAFEEKTRDRERAKPAKRTKEKSRQATGRFRLNELWLEDFKNLRDYRVLFDPTQGLDVVLGWNGTGKSNLFEALVIIFRDLHEWSEKNRWPDKPMSGFCLSYEINERSVQVDWRPNEMKRPQVKVKAIGDRNDSEPELIKREELPLPRFIFGYYSGPTNRLCEHFLPMKQEHYIRLREATTDDAATLAELLEQRRFFCAETHHAKYVLLAFSYKEDQKISEFLEQRLRILAFESALFIIRKPRWAKSGSKAEDFWGATGIMRRVMERLRRHSIAPMVLKQKLRHGYQSTTEDHYYFFLPDLKSLHSFAAEYQDARTFFLALESTDFSELIHDVKIQVSVRANNTDQVSITFHQLSEGEQQLLMVLGLMRFTKSYQSLVLLDEPDTHLNPHWSIDYLKDLARVMSDDAVESAEQQTSQILMASHDPLVIASLLKEQIHLLKRDSQTGICRWFPATVNPRGLGFTGILTSEMFGFRSDLDPETLADLDNRVRLVAKEDSLNAQEAKELESIDQRLEGVGFGQAFSDPYYAAFVRAWGRRHSELMAGQQFLSDDKRREVERIAQDVLRETMSELERE